MAPRILKPRTTATRPATPPRPTAPKGAAPKTPPSPTRGAAPAGATTVGPAPSRNVAGLKRNTAEAPNRVTDQVNSADDARRREAAKVQTKDRLKQAAEEAADALVAKLAAGEVKAAECKRQDLEALPNPKLVAVCKALGYKGYSGLAKAELVQFLVLGGQKPAAKTGSTRDLREQLAQAKRDGKVTGAVSAVKASDLKATLAAVEAGKLTQVTKPAPNAGTADHCKMLLRGGLAKGFTAEATAKAKAMFGVGISTLKADQLRKLVAALGLAK